MINVIVLWQTVYIQAALDHLAAKGYPIDPADGARLPHLGTPPSTSTVATAPPTAHPPPDSGRYESTDSGSRMNPRHRPSQEEPTGDVPLTNVSPAPDEGSVEAAGHIRGPLAIPLPRKQTGRVNRANT